MGSDKAQVTVGKRAMLDVVAGTASAVGEVVVIGGGQGSRWRVVDDVRPGRRGPLAGLETALQHAQGRDVGLVAVDQPFLRADTLQRLFAVDGDAVVPVDEGWDQVTCAVYREPCLAMARSAFDTGGDRSLQHLVHAVDAGRVDPPVWRSWGEDGRSWYSVDTPEALEEGLRRYGPVP